MTFPLLTIAAINGHGMGVLSILLLLIDFNSAFAGGMAFALSCDYRIITSGRGFLCMNEVGYRSSPLYRSS